MTIRYTPEAIEDLKELRRYISQVLGNPQAAAKIARGILDACAQLKDHPHLGPSLEVKLGQRTDLRYLICGKRIAIYPIDEDVVSVARILDCRQDYLRILIGPTEP